MNQLLNDLGSSPHRFKLWLSASQSRGLGGGERKTGAGRKKDYAIRGRMVGDFFKESICKDSQTSASITVTCEITDLVC